MDDRLSRVESTAEELSRSIQEIERRLAALERGHASEVHTPDAASSDAEIWAPPTVARDDFITVLSFIGRTFVALGGAYLLRALTDSAVLPEAAGIALGLAYAVSWLAMADRAGGRRQPLSAAFHGLVFAIIAFPLLWEATVRFKFLGPEATAAALTLVTMLGLGVAVHRRLQAVAWIVTLAALPAALALVAATSLVVPFAIFLIALGVATLWLGYSCDWIWVRWPVAVVADLAVFALTLRVSNGAWAEPPLRVLAVQMLLLNGYLGSIVVRTIIRARDVNVFEILQAMAVLGAGFGGAVYVAQLTGSGVGLLALINLGFGAGCYAVAFIFIAHRQELRRNFYFYTSLALVLMLVSSGLLLERGPLTVASAALACLSTWAARAIDRVTLSLHGAVYLLVAGAASGLLSAAGYALAGPVAGAWPPFTTTALLALGATAACWAMPFPPSASGVTHLRLSRLVVAVVFVWSAGGWIVALATPVVSGTPGAGADPGVVATIRTTVLAFAALALAWAGQRERFRESSWLLYPVLVTGAVKLLVEDLPHSKPSTLFVALALYGGALIAAPRLGHRHRPA